MPTPKNPDAQHGWKAAAGALRIDPALADGRERRLWTMSLEERIGAMRRGELTLDQLATWSRARPHEVPLVNGELSGSP